MDDTPDPQLLYTYSGKGKLTGWAADTAPRRRPLRITTRNENTETLNVSSGLLDKLPYEILDLIFLELDHGTLATLCTMNTKIKKYIKTRRSYKLELEHCYDILCSMKKNRILHRHSARDIFATLLDPQCSVP
ncbi:hypothetical protein BJX99DRAFT_208389 [Aspergillus californicus]